MLCLFLKSWACGVVGERPYMLRRSDSTTAWLQEFSLIYSLAKSIDIDQVSELFKEGL